jgi:hypothetical protein
MSPRKRKIHEHLPFTFKEVIETVTKGKMKDKKEGMKRKTVRKKV